ncbi:DnaJ domain-containing protein [Candidatus Campbellbacteria bacterium]|nr:MAG: DnaJ domain-containing protein [Candidatus Campbellbacteria bacterium]
MNQDQEKMNSESIEDLMSPKQQEIWRYISVTGEASPGDIVKATDIAMSTVRKSLERLVELKKIKRVGLGRATRYARIEQSTSLVASNTALDDTLEKKNLERAITEKEKQLAEILEHTEKIKVDLSVTKYEYDIKIGRLYLKLDEVELEILKLKKIGDLIDQGLSFEEAKKKVDESLQKRKEHIEEEYRKLEDEEKNIKGKKHVSEYEQEEIKRLYRKLAHKFHPDLNKGDDVMMKKVNQAYADNDLESLRAIDESRFAEDTVIRTIDKLKEKLAKLEAAVVKANQQYILLKKSEWYVLKENIESSLLQKRNLLHELADKVLTEIAKKQNQLAELKKKYGQ